MTKRLLIVALVTVTGSMLSGCEFSVGTNSGSAPKAANTSTSNTSNTNTTPAKSDSKSKPALADEKKPTGTAKTAKTNPVPDSWIYVYDEKKGYGFSLPEGSTGQSDKIEGVDVMVATTPAPSEVDVLVLAYKDDTLTKEDLVKDAVKFLDGMGAQKVTAGKLRDEGDDYAVADGTAVHPTRGNLKLRILVGTDVTDNYVMLLFTDEAKFAANESIIDSIWGSFEMWSSGS